MCGAGKKKFNNNFTLDKSINAMILYTRSNISGFVYMWANVCSTKVTTFVTEPNAEMRRETKK